MTRHPRRARTAAGVALPTLALALLAVCSRGGAATTTTTAMTTTTTATTTATTTVTATTTATVTVTAGATTTPPAAPVRATTVPTTSATAATTTRTGGSGPATTRAAGARTATTVGGAVPPPAIWGPTLPPLADGARYEDPQGRFSLSVPRDWTKLDAVQEANAAVGFAGPVELLRLNVGLVDVPVTNPTIEDFNQQYEQLLADQFTAFDYKPVSTARVVVAGRQAYKRVFDVTFQGRPLRVVQVYLLDNATLHTLAFTTPVELFAEQEPIFDGITGTYRVGR